LAIDGGVACNILKLLKQQVLTDASALYRCKLAILEIFQRIPHLDVDLRGCIDGAIFSSPARWDSPYGECHYFTDIYPNKYGWNYRCIWQAGFRYGRGELHQLAMFRNRRYFFLISRVIYLDIGFYGFESCNPLEWKIGQISTCATWIFCKLLHPG